MFPVNGYEQNIFFFFFNFEKVKFLINQILYTIAEESLEYKTKCNISNLLLIY